MIYEAPRDAVMAMLLDPAFRESVLERQHVDRGSASLVGNVMTLEQSRPAHVVPAFARKFVGDEIVIVQKETWSTDRAAIQVTIPGKPGHLTGQATLGETDGQTVEQVDLEVTVNVPLIGGKIETVIADIFAKGLDKEYEVGKEWLAR